VIDSCTASNIAEVARPSVPAPAVRVLTLTPFYPNTGNPAGGCFIAEILPWTQDLGIRNEVIAVRPAHRDRVSGETYEIPCRWKRYVCVPGNPGLPSAGRWLAQSLSPAIQRMQSEHAIDLIHAHAALPCGDAAERLGRKFGIPFVVSVHGLDVFSERQAGRIFGRWCRQVSERVYRSARAVICISDQIRRCVADLNPNACVVYNGVDAELFSPGPQQESPPVVLSVGNLIASKGQAVLLRAFARALESVPECRLEIVGEGTERSSLVRLAEQLCISNQVHFLGRQDRQSVAKVMQRCTVFALPSSYEGLGCVYLEAMACAKPAIGCEGQGIAEIIQHGINGMLVPPESEEGLPQVLQMLLHNRDFRRRLGSAARETILHKHSLQHQAEQLAAIYRECVA
jgi:glycosyltransferase involved in cell wall biosynthesis